MTTGLELYEALKHTVGEEAARMIAEALPMSERVATKTDIDNLRAANESRIDGLRTSIDAFRSELAAKPDKADLHAMEARTFRWMLGFFATLWLGNAGLIVTIVLKF